MFFLFLIKATFRVLCKYSDGGSRGASLIIKNLTVVLNPFCNHFEFCSKNSMMDDKLEIFLKTFPNHGTHCIMVRGHKSTNLMERLIDPV